MGRAHHAVQTRAGVDSELNALLRLKRRWKARPHLAGPKRSLIEYVSGKHRGDGPSQERVLRLGKEKLGEIAEIEGVHQN
jgi:hypothetical protein